MRTLGSHLLPTERPIIVGLIRSLIGRGFAVRVFDEEGEATSDAEITAGPAIAACGHTDSTAIDAFASDGSYVGTILLYHGLGHEVIGDYTDEASIAAIVEGLREED